LVGLAIPIVHRERRREEWRKDGGGSDQDSGVEGAEMTSARTLGVGKNHHSDQVKPHTNDK
jgi:hypothetical protein